MPRKSKNSKKSDEWEESDPAQEEIVSKKGKGTGPTLVPMLGSMKTLELGDGVKGWLEQFDIYCQLNVVDKNRKVLLFLSSLSSNSYNILRELVLPESPAEKSFDELKKLLLDYVSPPPNFFVERYHFRERKQQSNESVAEYVRVLKKMTEFCKYGGELDNALRDQLVWGVADISIKRKLLSDGGMLTFQQGVELASSMEMANSSAAQLTSTCATGHSSTSTKLFAVANQTNQRQQLSKVKCWCCGDPGHVKRNCKFLISTCCF